VRATHFEISSPNYLTPLSPILFHASKNVIELINLLGVSCIVSISFNRSFVFIEILSIIDSSYIGVSISISRNIWSQIVFWRIFFLILSFFYDFFYFSIPSRILKRVIPHCDSLKYPPQFLCANNIKLGLIFLSAKDNELKTN